MNTTPQQNVPRAFAPVAIRNLQFSILNLKLLLLALASAFSLPPSALVLAAPLGTAFTYHGRLADNGQPATGNYDLVFSLHNAELGGSPVGPSFTSLNTPVSNGLFIVAVDFGADVFAGEARWLEMAVRTNTTPPPDYTTLAPRQQIRPTPYALYANTVGTFTGTLPAAQITGTLPDARLSPNVALLNGSPNFTGTVTAGGFTGNGQGLTNLNLASVGPPGTFTVASADWFFSSTVNLGLPPTRVAPADFSHDGALDLVVAHNNRVTVLTNNRAGGFVPATSNAVFVYEGALTTADANRDGWADVVLITMSSNGVTSLVVLTNTTQGRLVQAQSSSMAAARAVLAVDIDNDGWVEVLTARLNSALGVAIFTNIHNGRFTQAANVPGLTLMSLAAADVNRDGWMDVIGVDGTADQLAVLTNNHRGSFALASSPAVGASPVAVASADVNGDGWADQISANYNANTLTVLTNDRSGGFALSQSLAVGAAPTAVAAADLNGDGWLDLASANSGNNTVTVLLNNGQGRFTQTLTLATGAGPRDVAAADLNGDTRADLVTANLGANTLTVLLANPSPGAISARFTSVSANAFLGNGAGLSNLTARGSLPWQTVTADGQLAANTAYFASNPTQVNLTLPATPQVGDVVRVAGLGGGWSLAVSPGQSIFTTNVPQAAGEVWILRESSRGWRGVASSADGTKLVAVAGSGWEWLPIYTSADSGATWTRREYEALWTSVASSADGTKLVASAYNGQIYASADSGVTWTPRESNRGWESVASSADGTKLVAVVNDGQIYTSTDSGTNWTARETNRDWFSVASSADGSKLVAAVGMGSEGQIYTSTDSGTNWTARESARHWWSVASSADGSKLVAAGYMTQIYTSTDSGVTWTARAIATNWWSVASSADGSKLVAAGDMTQIYTSTDSGTNWTPRESARDWSCVASSADGSKLVAVTHTGQIYTSVGASAASSLSGAQNATAELVYIGEGQWRVVSSDTGANLTSAPGGTLLISGTGAGWGLSGNRGTTAGANFLGTTDNQPLEIKVNSQQALRIEPSPGGGESPQLRAAGAITIGNTTNAIPPAGTLRWTGTDFEGFTGSNWVSLTGRAAPPVAPTIVTQPASQTVDEGVNVTFTVLASGTAPLSYQWRKNGANISGAINASLALNSVSPASAGSYAVVVTNSVGSVTSAVALLTVNPLAAPTILTPPVSQTELAGANVTFTVIASGTAPLGYQWRKNGANIAGAVASNLTLISVTATDAGSYAVTVSNAFGSVASGVATLTVLSAPGTNMVQIVPGSFVMGSPDTEVDRDSDESPQTTVTLTRGFWIGKYEVTQAEYQALMGNNPSSFAGDLSRPVEMVSWVDATNFCWALTQQERAAGRIPANYQYRLPTEAEWEYACRAGTTTRFSYGDDSGYASLANYAWYSANSGSTTHPVGQKLVNPWGLNDVQGNVYEWCQDWFGTYPGGSVSDPQGPGTGSYRVIRGGYWFSNAYICRSADRDIHGPSSGYGGIGFRVVLAPGQP
jgi:formylglycine-generating enzyme required for sulfatase activity/photosystem II stability/assembly factor-like uncharacterized protein